MVLSGILNAFWLALLIQIVMFIPAYFFKTDKLTDMSYGLTFIILAFIALVSNKISFAKTLLFIMILAWGLRLVIYLVIRIMRTKKDSRFDKIRGSFVKFFGFWILQGVTVWIVMLASLLFFNSEPISLSILSLIGFLTWLYGILIEGIADHQKFSFKNNPANRGSWIQTGLWKYSRHPNYFGEMLCWTGIYIYALPALSASSLNMLIGLASPLYIILMLRFVSGVPKLEKADDEKYKGNPEYKAYKKRTSMIILRPPRKTNK
jgi:steroid 5-alpha reductase family enzyme